MATAGFGPQTIGQLQQLQQVRHPSVLRIRMVYPAVHEVQHAKPSAAPAPAPAASAAARAAQQQGGDKGPTSASATTVFSHQPLPPAPAQQQQAGVLQQLMLAMAGVPTGRGGAEASAAAAAAAGVFGMSEDPAQQGMPGGPRGTSRGVYLTSVLPRRERYASGAALMLELFPSITLREAIKGRWVGGWVGDGVSGFQGLGAGQVGVGGAWHGRRRGVCMLHDAVMMGRCGGVGGLGGV